MYICMENKSGFSRKCWLPSYASHFTSNDNLVSRKRKVAFCRMFQKTCLFYIYIYLLYVFCLILYIIAQNRGFSFFVTKYYTLQKV